MALRQAQHTLRGNGSVGDRAGIRMRHRKKTKIQVTELVQSCSWDTRPDGLGIVFVFTLDCNNCIYCYDAEDENMYSRLAENNKHR